MSQTNYSVSQIKRFIFLKEIFLLAVSAYGGPGAHYALFVRHLVNKRKYLTEKELLELHSFCSMLPGPTSTQIITCLGFKLGGRWLAIAALVIWVLPASIIMTLFVLGWNFTDKRNIPRDFLHFIQPMAIGFIAAASIQVVFLLKRNSISMLLYLLGAVAAALFRSPWVFPFLIVIGGFVSHYFNKEKYPAYKPKIDIRWRNAGWLLGILIVVAVTGNITQLKPVLLFGNSYQYGGIVFGGGNVLIPMMFKQYVTFKEYMSAEDFITGVGLVQAIPGPVFSISTYANGMAMQDWGTSGQILGCIIGTVGIFLPGMLVAFLLFPLWDQIKQHQIIRKAIEGITAVSAGLILAAAYLMFRNIQIEWENLATLSITVLLILFTKIPSPVIVIVTMMAGLLRGWLI